MNRTCSPKGSLGRSSKKGAPTPGPAVPNRLHETETGAVVFVRGNGNLEPNLESNNDSSSDKKIKIHLIEGYNMVKCNDTTCVKVSPPFCSFMGISKVSDRMRFRDSM